MTAPQPRLQSVDALRGVALLGILAVNIWVFADPWYASGASNPTYASALDTSVRFLVTLLAETKFYLLFSFLFGYSFTLQMASAERTGASFTARTVRRQAGLLALGLAHGALLYPGDILSTYALLGLVLLACRRMSAGTAARAGVTVVVLAGIAWVALGALTLAAGDPGTTTGDGPAGTLAAFGGSAAQTLAHHAGQLPGYLLAVLVLQAPSALAMMLLGYAAGRRRLLATWTGDGALGRAVLRVGAPVGAAGALVYATVATVAPGGGLEMIALGIGQLTAPLLTAAYVAGFLRLLASRRGSVVESALAPAGRTALSGYLGQSVALGLVFTGYGLGLVDTLSPLAVLACVPVLFAVQLVLSRWWLSRHAYGPVEWGLRALTVWGRPPYRGRAAAAAAA